MRQRFSDIPILTKFYFADDSIFRKVYRKIEEDRAEVVGGEITERIRPGWMVEVVQPAPPVITARSGWPGEG